VAVENKKLLRRNKMVYGEKETLKRVRLSSEYKATSPQDATLEKKAKQRVIEGGV